VPFDRDRFIADCRAALEERPFDTDRAMRLFEESNRQVQSST
jgi:hypothetical protein